MKMYHQLFIFLIGISYGLTYYVPSNDNEPWDVILFTQNWPVSECLDFKQRNIRNECRMPNSSLWTIHGVWPTKFGTKGPGFCDRSMKFEIDQLNKILTTLESRWLSIQGNKRDSSFWKHEWEKHGTCAAELKQLDTELAYFERGLNWNKVYNMSDILAQSGVSPGTKGYSLDDIAQGVSTVLGVDPFISCFKDKTASRYFLLEVRICFDKSLELVNCDGVKLKEMRYHRESEDGPLAEDCPTDGPVYYPEFPESFL